MMDLSLQVAQKQILSPKLQQSVTILQMDYVSLLDYVDEICKENPLLDWAEQIHSIHERTHERTSSPIHCETIEKNFSEHAHDICDTLSEYLNFQIRCTSFEEGIDQKTLYFLAESLTENGYLEYDIEDVLVKQFEITAEKAWSHIEQFQRFEPVGVGGRGLKECLLIQLQLQSASPLALELLEHHLEALAKNKLNVIAKERNVKIEEIVEAFYEIKACNPRPSNGFLGGTPLVYTTPDVKVIVTQELQLEITLFNEVTPHLGISSHYHNVLSENTEPETRAYILKKMEQANWIRECVQKREMTLLKVANAIANFQKTFFTEGNLSTIKPLKLCDIATTLEIHESTVSRCIKDKYVQCKYGVFPMNYFFSKGISTKLSEETMSETTEISTKYIHELIKEIVENENKSKPYSDSKIEALLQEKNIEISRRTIAKYRDVLGIPVASQRKRY